MTRAVVSLSLELGFHSHTLLPPLAVHDGAAASTWWLLRRGGAVVFSGEGDASAAAMVDLW